MPESVKDRPTNATEKIYLFAKSERYYYDADAIKVSASPNTHSKGPAYHPLPKTQEPGLGIKQNSSFESAIWDKVTERNAWNYWLLSPAAFSDVHFATFPPELPEKCIKAGTSERGCCPECGAPWRRVVSVEQIAKARNVNPLKYGGGQDGEIAGKWTASMAEQTRRVATTTGWQPSCRHAHSPIPCTVLDIFTGSGTTGMVALRLGRSFVGLELKEEYVEMATRRILNDAPLFNSVGLEAAG
jgi:DNA modification methylase